MRVWTRVVNQPWEVGKTRNICVFVDLIVQKLIIHSWLFVEEEEEKPSFGPLQQTAIKNPKNTKS